MTDRTYEEELDVLSATYAAAGAQAGYLRERHRVMAMLGSSSVAFVGTGGSLAVAQLGAHLHEVATGRLARAMTPLDYLGSPLEAIPVVIVSDSMSHPDILTALIRAQASGPVVVLTNRQSDDIVAICSTSREGRGASSVIVACPRPGRDGYVATNSVLSLSLGLIALYTHERPPAFEPWMDRWVRPEGGRERDIYLDRDEIVCVHSPDLRNAATDLEARLAESGLGTVQLTDLRNVAHGRHVGLAERAGRLGLVLMASAPWLPLASMTDSLLPGTIERRTWGTRAPWPYGCIEMLLASIGFLGVRARRMGVDPGNPHVRTFGNELFTMGLQGLVPETKPAWIRR